MTEDSSEEQQNEVPGQILNVTPNRFTANKKLKQYFFEFALVFLAVFLGFLAETYREYISDRSKERVYVSSLIKDLQSDEVRLSEIIKLNKEKLLFLDTAYRLRKSITNKPEFYLSLNRAVSMGIWQGYFFKSNDATMTEMKTGGGLTLLPREVIDSLTSYESSLYPMQKEEIQYEHNGMQAIEFFMTLTEDWDDFNSTMSANDKELKRLFNYCVNVRSSVYTYHALLVGQKMKAIRLINYLRDKYHIS